MEARYNKRQFIKGLVCIMGGGIVSVLLHGDHLYVVHNDGSREICRAVGNNQWRGSGVGKKPDIDPGGDPGAADTSGAGDVIFTREMVLAGIRAMDEVERHIVGGNASDVAKAMNAAVARDCPGRVNTREKAAVMLGQACQETGGFTLLTERGGPFRYDPYRGRGWIQVTWKDNYRAFGGYVHSKGLLKDPNYFVSHYRDVASMKWAAHTVCWEFNQPIWKSGGRGNTLLDYCADERGWRMVSRAINRGRITSSKPAYGESLRIKCIKAILKVTPEPTKPSKGGYFYPVKKPYTLTAHWKQRGPYWSKWHTGQDFAGPTGTPIYAVGAGKILPPAHTKAAGPNFIALQLPTGETFTYWHCSKKYVSTGATVKAGQKIGAIGAMGNVSGPHLHFEYYKKGINYHNIYSSSDPMIWLKKNAKQW